MNPQIKDGLDNVYLKLLAFSGFQTIFVVLFPLWVETSLLCLDEDTFLLGCSNAAGVRLNAKEKTFAILEELILNLLSLAPAFRRGISEAGPGKTTAAIILP